MVPSTHGALKVPNPLADLGGTILEQRYEVGRMLGSGGMGAVFEGRHLRLERPVAIKVLWPSFANEGTYVARFLREAKAASQIRHRNVVELLDYGETNDGLVYSVMELLDGQDLQQLLASQPKGRVSWSRACGLLVQIASGLKAAHAHGVIHRDIKPANCFLTEEDDEPLMKVLDFGVAKLEDCDRTNPLTGAAQVLGTPSYIAPEMVVSQTPASVLSDVYALGVVAYRMLTGNVPFAAKSFFELLHKAVNVKPASIRAQVPAVPRAVEMLVMDMLAKKPKDRPADMQTVRDRLLEVSQETLGPRAVKFRPSEPISLVPERDEPRRARARRQSVGHEFTGASTVPDIHVIPAVESSTQVAPRPRLARPEPTPPPIAQGPRTEISPAVCEPGEEPTPAPLGSAPSMDDGVTMPALQGEPQLCKPIAPRRWGGFLVMLGAAGALMSTGVLVGMKLAGGPSAAVVPPASHVVVEAPAEPQQAVTAAPNETASEPEAAADEPEIDREHPSPGNGEGGDVADPPNGAAEKTPPPPPKGTSKRRRNHR